MKPGSVIADRYRIEGLLGEGGMGSVWRAHNLDLDAPCAIKIIHDDRAHRRESQERFRREARAAAKLRSPNVVQVFELGEWEGMHYIVMELLGGVTLDDLLERYVVLSLSEIEAIVAQVAEALSLAEQGGIVHRDLKPENIFLVGGYERGQDAPLHVKVLDFGIAKLTTAGSGAPTQTGAVLGTPNYMSPEQAHGAKSVDHRSDLWSLGVIAFECATGRLPFADEGLGALLNAIMSGPIPVPSAFEPTLGEGFDAWFAKACARDPAHRFSSARELSAALAELVGDVDTPPSGAIASSRRVQRRKRANADADAETLPADALLSAKNATSTGPVFRTATSRGPRANTWRKMGFAAAIVASLGVVSGILVMSTTSRSTRSSQAATSGEVVPASTTMPASSLGAVVLHGEDPVNPEPPSSSASMADEPVSPGNPGTNSVPSAVAATISVPPKNAPTAPTAAPVGSKPSFTAPPTTVGDDQDARLEPGF